MLDDTEKVLYQSLISGLYCTLQYDRCFEVLKMLHESHNLKMNPSAWPVMSHLLWKERWIFSMERLIATFSSKHYYNTKQFTETHLGEHMDFFPPDFH